MQAGTKSEPKVKQEKKVKKKKEVKREQKEKKMKVEKRVRIEPKAEVKEQKVEPSSFKKGKRPASSDLSAKSSKTRMLTRAVTRGMNFVETADFADPDNMTIEEMVSIGEERVYETADLSDSDSGIDDKDSDEQEEG